MSTSLLYHALRIRDYGRTDRLASNGRRLAASTACGSVARVLLWPWFTPFRPCCDRNMGRKKSFTGRTRPAAGGVSDPRRTGIRGRLEKQRSNFQPVSQPFFRRLT
jgi:hypothetical protein